MATASGDKDARPLCHRFFFALRPDPETARRTYAFACAELGGERLVPPERLHVTLALTGDFEEPRAALLAALRRVGDAVSAQAFDLPLDRLASWDKVVALRPATRVSALDQLHFAIAAAMAGEGLGLRESWTFEPHETLAPRKNERFERPVDDLGWHVASFELVHSFVGLQRYETVARWPLACPQTGGAPA